MTSKPARIADLRAWECLDSRGNPTVACRAVLDSGDTGRALVPAGASVGSWESDRLLDSDSRFGGRGVRKAVALIEDRVKHQLVGLSVDEADEVLSGPANATLAVSVAVAKAAAATRGQELWQALAGSASPGLPCPMINIFSGGRHAEGAGPIQDYLVIPLGARSFRQAIEQTWVVRSEAAEIVRASKGKLAAAMVADEGGLALPDPDPEIPLRVLTEAIEKSGHEMGIALDVAANEVAMESTALIELLARLAKAYPIVSIEDPVSDTDWEAWSIARQSLPVDQIVGDDLFATNAERIQEGIAAGVANAALIKPDQVGTLQRASDALDVMRSAGMRPIVSARSGDTEDFWLADLCVGWDVEQIKIGSLVRSERLAKYNRLLELEAVQGLQMHPYQLDGIG